MKLLYIGSRSDESDTLTLEREMNELQRLFTQSASTPAKVIFLPNTIVEDLADEILKHQPDVLHISTHGELRTLELINRRNVATRLTADDLNRALTQRKRPRLVYLNACDSAPLAEQVVQSVPMAIGTSAAISNGAARAAALRFYDRLLRGFSVYEAHREASDLVALMQPECSTRLSLADGVDPTREILNPAMQIVAKIGGQYVDASGRNVYAVKIGLVHCPSDVRQSVIFTDDDDFAKSKGSLEDSLCWVIRDKPIKGLIWMEGNYDYYGDFPMYASAVTSAREIVTAVSTLSGSLRAWAALKNMDGDALGLVEGAAVDLEQHDGAE